MNYMNIVKNIIQILSIFIEFKNNNKLFQSTQNLNNETNLYLKIKTNFENNIRIEENNTFYLDYLYFKHVNIAKEKKRF